jgi:DNA-binding response OmpR family regulator
MKNIILNYKNGISKNELYKILWPNDYEIHLNKIDTHLSNLKNFLHKEINYNLNYSTNNSIIKFDL